MDLMRGSHMLKRKGIRKCMPLHVNGFCFGYFKLSTILGQALPSSVFHLLTCLELYEGVQPFYALISFEDWSACLGFLASRWE